MKYQIKEFGELTGVSVRTLHYYDEIGLLKPCCVDEHNGYRFYDENSLERMQEILFYRELDFSLKDIQEILQNPNYNKSEALEKQKHLLVLKNERIKRLINALDNAMKGVNIMDKNVFDNSEYKKVRNEYAAEARKKWGKTSAYKESQNKTADYSKDKWNEVNGEMNSLIAEFAKLKANNVKPSDKKAQTLVKAWQDMITRNYYNCTDEILCGLGQMYIADERFTKNIDKFGDGTASYISEAIKIYCKK